MHLWKVEPLAKKLGRGQVSEKVGMQYFLVSTLLGPVDTNQMDTESLTVLPNKAEQAPFGDSK